MHCGPNQLIGPAPIAPPMTVYYDVPTSVYTMYTYAVHIVNVYEGSPARLQQSIMVGRTCG